MNKKAHCDGMILESIQLVEELLDQGREVSTAE